MRAIDRNPTLREILNQHYLPVLFASGFTGPRKLRSKKLEFYYERIAGEKTHRLTIRFDRSRRSRFGIELAVLPEGGIGPVIRRGGVVPQGRLRSGTGPFASSWFHGDLPGWKRWLGRDPTGRARRAVDACLRLWPEVEAWWATQRPSPHIRVRRIVYRGTESKSG